MKKIRLEVLLVLALIGFLTFGSTPSSSEPQQNDPIIIGVFTPETAGLTVYAPWTKQGFELGMIYATDDTNETTGGRPYEIKYYDTQGSTTAVVTTLTNAIENDGIDIIVGGTSSAVAGAMVPIAEQYEKLYFITPAASSGLTEDPLFNKYIFRVARNSWHDAKAGVKYAWDTIGARSYAFIAPDYSFGWAGVGAMQSEVIDRGGKIAATEYVPSGGFGASDITPYLNRIADVDADVGIDMLMIVWAGSFAELFRDMGTVGIENLMNISSGVIDTFSMDVAELSFVPPATQVGTVGLSVYGYELPDNDVNDWMVQAHIDRNIRPNAGQVIPYTYRVPELFTASGFATAQFLVDVTNKVSNLNVDDMICHLEGLSLETPKGNTTLRAEDHQGLAEMYIAKVINDTRTDSETYGHLIGELVETLPPDVVAPPIKTDYVPCALQTGGGGVPGFESPALVIGLGFIGLVTLVTSKRRKY